MAPGGIGVAVGFPAAAAGKVAAPVLNKAHHIGQRIAQKHADLMRKLRRAAEPPGQLGQHDPRLLLLLGQLISLPCQKSADCFVRKDCAQACFAVNIDQELVRPHTAFQHPDAEALAGQLLVPAAHAAGKV